MADDDILDDDLQELLDQLDGRDEAVEQILQESDVDEEEDLSPPTEVVVSDLPDISELQNTPLDERDMEIITPVAATETAPIAATVNVAKYHERLDQVTEDVLAACRADRQEAQDVIDLVRRQIDDAVNKNQAPQRMWVDGLVKAVEVKAGINATAVKIIEANAKMLAATKAGVNILNQNIQSGSEDLEDVLSKPLTEFDEY